MTGSGREGQFSSGLWPLVDCLCSRGGPHTSVYMGGTSWTQGLRRKDIAGERVGRVGGAMIQTRVYMDE